MRRPVRCAGRRLALGLGQLERRHARDAEANGVRVGLPQPGRGDGGDPRAGPAGPGPLRGHDPGDRPASRARLRGTGQLRRHGPERPRARRHRGAARRTKSAHLGGVLPRRRRARGDDRRDRARRVRGRLPLPRRRRPLRDDREDRRGPLLPSGAAIGGRASPRRSTPPSSSGSGLCTPSFATACGSSWAGRGRRSSPRASGTRDGKGIVFVAHDGQVHPAGFLPLGLGSVRDKPLLETYRDDLVLRAIRSGEFPGSLRAVRVHRRLRRIEGAGLCGHGRSPRRRPGLLLCSLGGDTR